MVLGAYTFAVAGALDSGSGGLDNRNRHPSNHWLHGFVAFGAGGHWSCALFHRSGTFAAVDVSGCMRGDEVMAGEQKECATDSMPPLALLGRDLLRVSMARRV